MCILQAFFLPEDISLKVSIKGYSFKYMIPASYTFHYFNFSARINIPSLINFVS